MKMKLLLFVGLIIGSIGLTALFSSPASAIGETYRWINENTVEGSGGSYVNEVKPSGIITFTRVGTSATYTAPDHHIAAKPSGGGIIGGQPLCQLQLALSIDTSNAGAATLQVNSEDARQCTTELKPGAVTLSNVDENGPDPASFTDTTEGEIEETSTCEIDAVGWIICPVVTIMAELVDGAYAFVSSLLVVQPLLTTGESENIYNAWTMMRNFANAAFVIAFLLIIFSQLTSFGMNNYGIKKMLPRLIVAAILVNVSFWVCALAVDISNILGSSLNSLFNGMGAGLPDGENKSAIATGEGWVGITGLVLAGTIVGAGFLYATLSALLPALLAALVAIVAVFLVLTLRQALIVLLIVISPLAFVAYLLPNTESLFKKWMALFKTLLLMYPIIAVIFGASALASTIVMASASGDYVIAIQIMGALIAIIPLALTPVVMKTAGGLLNRFGGIVNNPNRGPVDKIRKGAEGFRDRRQAIAGKRRMDRGQWALDKTGGLQNKIRGDGSSKFRSRAATALGSAAAGVASSSATTAHDAQQKNEYAKRALTEGQQDYVANRASTDARYAQNLAGPTGNATNIEASAVAAMRNRQQSEIKDASEIIYNLNLDPKEIRKLALGGVAEKDGKVVAEAQDNLALRNAARQLVVNNGDAIGVKALLDSTVGNADEKDRLGVADAFAASNNRPAFVSQGYMGQIRQGTNGDTQSAIETSIINNTWSADAIANADKDVVNMVARVAKTTTNPEVKIEFKQRLVDNAHTALTDPDLKVKLGKSLDDVVDLRNHEIPRRPIT